MIRIRELQEAGLTGDIGGTLLSCIDTDVMQKVLPRIRVLYREGPTCAALGVCSNLARPESVPDSSAYLPEAYDAVKAVAYLYPESWCARMTNGTYATLPFFLESDDDPIKDLWEGAGLERRKAFMRFMYRTLWDELVRREAVLAADFEALE